MINKFISILSKYKKYKGETYCVDLVSKNTGHQFSIRTDLDLDNKMILPMYRQSLRDDGIIIRNIYKKPIPTFITRIILFLEYIFFGYYSY